MNKYEKCNVQALRNCSECKLEKCMAGTNDCSNFKQIAILQQQDLAKIKKENSKTLVIFWMSFVGLFLGVSFFYTLLETHFNHLLLSFGFLFGFFYYIILIGKIIEKNRHSKL